MANSLQRAISGLLLIAAFFTGIFLATLIYRAICNYPAVPQTVIVDSQAVDIAGPIEPNMASTVIAQLNLLVAGGATHIDIVINTPGGVVQSAEEILNAMSTAQTMGAHIRCFVQGQAASAGVIILSQCNERYAEFSAVIMWHSVAMIGSGKFNDKSTQDLLDVISSSNTKYWATTRQYFYPWYFTDNFMKERLIPALEVEANGLGYLRVIRKLERQSIVLFPPFEMPPLPEETH